MEGPHLSQKPASRRQEEDFLKRARETLLNDFPNPERKGCPDSETIRAIAYGRIKGEEAGRWRVHAATCSPCTREYVAFRGEVQRARRLRGLAAIAAALILAVIAGLALTRLGLRGWGWQEANLDLRGREALRGSESTQTASPLVLPRGKLALTIDLPVGSEPGVYEVQVVQGPGQPVSAAIGKADLVEGVTVLKLRLDLRREVEGPAFVSVRRSGQSRAQYALLIK